MIQRLRRKFTAMATLVLLVVIVTIMSGMIGLSYRRYCLDVDNVLTVLSQNDGQLVSQQGLASAKQRLGNRFNVESMFQYRYFSVVVDQKGHSRSVIDNHIWTVNRSQIMKLGKQAAKRSNNAPSLIDRVLRRSPSQGHVKIDGTEYAYRVTPVSNGQKLVVFLDETAIMEDVHDLVRVCLLIGVACLVLFMVVLWLISGIVVRPMAENERRQKQFITNAGHELKTPLAVISANNEMQEMMDGESEWTKSNHVQITRLTRLINRLISIAKLGENPQIDLQPLDLSQKTESIAKSFEAVAKADEKRLNIEIKPGLRANADERCYEELVNILLDNAVKYCDDKSEISIQLYAKSKRQLAMVVGNSYQDGRNEDFNHFFERFYREDQSHHHGKKGGFGVGLSMAKNLATVMKGSINASWNDGKIYFTVTMPRLNEA